MSPEDKPFIYPICGEITWDLASKAIDEVYHAYVETHFDRLILPITSQGGDPDAAWSIYTSFKNLGCQIITLACGKVYSSGVIIFLTSSIKRYAYKEAIFLFHPATISREGDRNYHNISEDLSGIILDNKFFKDILKKELKTASKNDIIKLTHSSNSYYVDAQQANKIGLVTKIVDNFNQI